MDDLKTVREAAKRLAEIERLVDAGRRMTGWSDRVAATARAALPSGTP